MLPTSYNKICLCIYNFYGATTPSAPGAPRYGGFTLRHTTLGGTPLGERSARRRNSDNTQHSKKTDIHAPCGIRTHNPSKRAAADPRLISTWQVKQRNLKKIIMSKNNAIGTYTFNCPSPYAITALWQQGWGWGSFLPRHKGRWPVAPRQHTNCGFYIALEQMFQYRTTW